MNAGTLNCPSCGAVVASDSTECAFCHARLATIGCPSCFGLVFVGARFCQHCGAAVTTARPEEGPSRKCPRGCGPLKRETIGTTELYECERCHGVWLDPATFEKLCAEKEQPAPALFDANAAAAGSERPSLAEAVRYVPCPVCGALMNRTNFSRTSGVIVDTCKPHGVWFDVDELRRVIEFVRAGGIEKARERELMELQEERKLREFERRVDSVIDAQRGNGSPSDSQPSGVSILAELLGVKTRRL